MFDRILFLGVLLWNLAGYDCENLKNKELQKQLLSVERFAQIYCGDPECIQKEEEREKRFYERFAQFHCNKLMSCTKGGDKVCGYDIRSTDLAYFSDRCKLHTANCNKAGTYSHVELVVCDTKSNYTVSFDDEFQFEPTVKNTPAPIGHPDNPDNVTYVDNTVVRLGTGLKKVGLNLVKLVKGEINLEK